MAPSSFVLSRTVMTFAVCGMAAANFFTLNGRNILTLRTPSFSPLALRAFTVSSTVSAPLPIMTMIFSASGAPSYW